MKPIDNNIFELCYHCGEKCQEESLNFDERNFCCPGCKLVYEVLQEHDLSSYYDYGSRPGTRQSALGHASNQFDYLDEPEVIQKLVDFSNDKETHITFKIPAIHCASCIWLLENLHQLKDAIFYSRTDFVKKECQIKFYTSRTSLKEVVKLLFKIGYMPTIDLSSYSNEKEVSQIDKRLIYKLAVAGFCFGNMMFFSLPEYFSEVTLLEEQFRGLFGYLNLALSLPIVFYAATDYYRSAWFALKNKTVNMDVPIVMGIAALFFYSLFEVFGGGTGYLDSLGGLIFFLLIGKYYQQKTYDTLSFDRDYTAYFPLAVTRMKQEREEVVSLPKLQVGDTIKVRGGELIPADSLLIQGDAQIDYSFVTGEEIPVSVRKGRVIYAGGRQQAGALLLNVQKEPSQGYLTGLWNHDSFKEVQREDLSTLANKISGKFTVAILVIALATFVFWSVSDMAFAVKAFSSVLIVACPCALALSTPFTLGNTLRIMGNKKFFLKNGQVIEQLAGTTDYVFDKTGTLTDPGLAQVEFIGEVLPEELKSAIKMMVGQSSHPLSHRINSWLPRYEPVYIEGFEEQVGSGLEAIYQGDIVRLGSPEWLGLGKIKSLDGGNRVYVAINGKVIGYFHVLSTLRKGVTQTIQDLQSSGNVHVLSGDKTTDAKKLKELLGAAVIFNFDQSPMDKLEYLRKLNTKGKSTVMIGDGLNDAGALQASTVGIAVTDQATYFSPASDAIMDVEVLSQLPAFLSLARSSKQVIIASFIISFLYNIVGISLAVQGLLSPVVCAVLMPLSSISIVAFTSVSMNYLAYRKGLKNNWLWK
ncbi:ATPase [Echinicola strongylocentroti]|uniref:ATPase n=1 Tax=Echinicola strongylocentroti TaxID=1795355 RepID=A0A2Z4IRS5_9BACT|nr:heavy metal translocating P-type ATPase metal-binding domain-containing protein [Echinicola strongylocentroti]AWW33276.1 ATPase [Echinicola strongylocentroti]